MAKAKRNLNGRSTLYQSKDGKWHGRVSMGVRDDGKPDRRHIERWDKNEVIAEIKRLEKLRDEGNAPKAGGRMKVEAWLTYWINEVAVVPTIRQSTHDGYRVDVVHHLIPGIGQHWLDKLTFTHLERLYAKMQTSGLKPATAHHVHRTIRVALGEAHRRQLVTRNVAKDAKAPVIEEEEIEPYDVDEIKDLLEVAALRRNSARWVLALALGLRQGEALGLKWDDFDLDKGILRIRRQAIRPKYAHGCGDVCGRKPGYCPQKIRTNPLTAVVKSKAGRRRIGLPPFVVALLRRHKEAQDAERVAAGDKWQEGGWVFAKPDGSILNTNTDHHEWKDLLEEAGLREGRLHDARHTAATVLLILEVSERTTMSIMGWSSTANAKRYQHVIDAIRLSVARRVGDLLWGNPGVEASGWQPLEDHFRQMVELLDTGGELALSRIAEMITMLGEIETAIRKAMEDEGSDRQEVVTGTGELAGTRN
ncbi:tyrosine-type recombinase/integrase [Actinomadura rayongensis]|uniref:Tyrosine-type recombinase/integrase n=1 Tax=Actinomadura rayongensis TaxID=1429076 RepID=A0A6I4W902_9ACTN|nr:site-specific integrase [Actinomadura rayongensis]MXQ65653.1 tyrosine-type recombinase/integrase [Actinomadura rayongensis]